MTIPTLKDKFLRAARRIFTHIAAVTDLYFCIRRWDDSITDRPRSSGAGGWRKTGKRLINYAVHQGTSVFLISDQTCI